MNEQLAINNGQLAFYKNCRKKLESLLHAQEPRTITLPNTPNPQQSVSHDTERAFDWIEVWYYSKFKSFQTILPK